MTTAVCFDFDGTLGDTESPAMEVAFWEVAAYLPSLPVGKEEGKEGGREGGKNPCV
jgi:beta-phosphoglucomutase-like phosphatase (HAD superfamily)